MAYVTAGLPAIESLTDMAESTAAQAYDVEEQLARIRRSQEETVKFIAEQRKLFTEADKLYRDSALAPWQVVITAMAAGAALFGAGAAFMKLIGS